jgi:peptidoglycan/LPS O-acetylase OafA/YrhL
MITYRPEVDGLRAIAVVVVILGHAGFGLFSGGFVGVDIFFVISGYLISSIVISELRLGTFSYTNFYERRARRLLPALLCVLLLASIPSYFFMLPDELENYGQSLIATIGFGNNILLWMTSGYWDLNSEFKPLLHTWSLGVEEQFYIIFPALILFIISRYRENAIIGIFSLIFVASFLMTALMESAYSDFVFYLLPTRVWELTAGIIVSLLQFRLNNVSDLLSGLASILGIILIVVSILVFEESNSGVDLIVPVLGTSLVILFSRKGKPVARILSLPLMVKIGLLSYSAYLIHMPLFAYARLFSQTPPDTNIFMVLIGVTFLLAWLFYKFIEMPFRGSSIPITTFVKSSLIIFAVIFLYGVFLIVTKGLSVSYYGEERYGESSTWVSHVDRIYDFNEFSREDNDFTKILILGNSYGRDFANILLDGSHEVSIDIVYSENFYDCDLTTINNMPSKLFKLVQQADIILLGSGLANQSCVPTAIKNIEKMDKKIFYLGYKNFGYNLNFLKIRSFIDIDGLNSKSMRLESEITRNQLLREKIPSRNFLSLMDILSDGEFVSIVDDTGRLLSVDRTHLTKPGSVFLGRLFYESDNELVKIINR